jgi:hypothetical protein
MQQAIILYSLATAALISITGTARAAQTELRTSADAHVDGNNPDVNYGGAEVLDISQTDAGGCKAYLLFDASGWGTNISRIGDITFTCASGLTRSYIAYIITGDGANDWTESEITWNNAPANDVTGTAREFVARAGQTVTLLGSISGGGDGTVLSIPFGPGSAGETALLEALNTGSRKATIGIRYNSTQAGSIVGFYSKEHGVDLSARLTVLPPERVLPATMDAHINWVYASINFGTAEVLSLSQSTVGGQKAFVQFDASSLGATPLQRAEKIRVYWAGSVNITRTLQFVMLSGKDVNAWTETEINWDNAPANNTPNNRGFFPFADQVVTVFGTTQYVAGAQREMNFIIPEGSAGETALLSALNTGDRKATIGIAYNSSQETTVGVYSRESNGGIYTPTIWFAEKRPTARLLGFSAPENRPILELAGPANANYTIVSSTNLTDWADVETVPVTTPPFQWTDPSEAATQRFYKIRVQ